LAAVAAAAAAAVAAAAAAVAAAVGASSSSFSSSSSSFMSAQRVECDGMLEADWNSAVAAAALGFLFELEVGSAALAALLEAAAGLRA